MAKPGQSREKLYRNLASVGLISVVAACVAPIPTTWKWQVAAPGGICAAVFAIAWLFAGPSRGPEATDFITDASAHYFERDGLGFAPTLTVIDGLCWFNVYYQNRYDGACRGKIYFLPLEGMSQSPSVPSDVPPVVADFECGGGDAAMISFPYPIAAKWQGRIMLYDVTAAVQRTGNWGALVRSREGAPVRAPSSGQIEALHLAGVALFGFAGVLAATLADRPGASFETRLPDGVAERTPPNALPRKAVLSDVEPRPDAAGPPAF